MGAIAAVTAKKDANVIPYTIRMLDALKHRGKDAHGIATAKSVNIARMIQDLTSSDIKSNTALGHNFAPIISSDVPQPVQDNGIKLIFEGRLFPPIGTCEAVDVAKMIKTSPEEEAKRLIKEQDGSYAFVFQHGNQLIAGRDPMGLIPLYYGENSEVYAFASERKALWSINIRNVKSFPPGNLAIINNGHINFQPVKTITEPTITNINEEDAMKKLYGLLLKSIKERMEGAEKLALAFSGGLDSSLIAALIREYGKQVLLVIVGLEGQPEVQLAENVAEMLGLPFKSEAFTFDDVENVFDGVLWLVEEPDFLKISVAIPFFWAAKTASHTGYKILLAGQGSDELFGGYKRYLREYGKSSESAENTLYKDTLLSYQVNFERDNKVSAFHGVELRLPFVDSDLISFSLGLPLRFKIESSEDTLRKRILRKIAEKVGLPSQVYNRPKKAIQYSTGVDKALKKLARKRGRNIREFVESSFMLMQKKYFGSLVQK